MPRPHPRLINRLLERALADLPPLPQALTQVLTESQRVDVSPHSLEAIIGTDQALTSKVLKVVNSAYYGLPGRVQSLGQACVILGVSQIRNLALSMATLMNATPTTPSGQEMQLRFWKHAFGAASCSQMLIRRKGIGMVDEDLAFVGGLLHDIGRLFLYANFSELYLDALAVSVKHRVPMQQVEFDFTGMDHCTIGGRMSRAWNLPDDICRLIEGHEGPLGSDASPALCAVHIGDCLNEYLYEEDADFVLPPCDQLAFQWFDGSEADWASLISYTAEKVDAASRCYGIAA